MNGRWHGLEEVLQERQDQLQRSLLAAETQYVEDNHSR
jgi:hypothetical protein